MEDADMRDSGAMAAIFGGNVPAERPEKPWENLRRQQRQLDQDGVEVGVSREALEETLFAFETMRETAQMLSDRLQDPMQDPKYLFTAGRVFNRQSLEPIPDDEPVMVFRARDRYALQVIQYYAMRIRKGPPGHIAAVERREQHFLAFATTHPDRMKEPDTEVADA